MRLYRPLGHELAASLGPGRPYQQWIANYAGDDFGQLCAQLESLLDEIAFNQPCVQDACHHAMQCELDFFSAPLADSP